MIKKLQFDVPAVVIVDDFLPSPFGEEAAVSIGAIRSEARHGSYNWIEATQIESSKLPIAGLIEFIINSFKINTDDVAGFEYWSNDIASGDAMSFHSDIDEALYKRTRRIISPLLTCVYYVAVSNVRGGSLVFEDGVIIKPRANRLALFFGGTRHGVEKVESGRRLSIVVNFWDRVPLSYQKEC
ncbi:2OG-Fe(II) oxygenase [Methylobacterium trifolii]|uniref:2OG-Fe(II) oxygenase n=1 Tax=Methylobacterium trifolii TaxID=1003092 RepID=UPI001EDE8082|nr:2OG-Fe(II) oxygenase [Methylobacterium trifolii]